MPLFNRGAPISTPVTDRIPRLNPRNPLIRDMEFCWVPTAPTVDIANLQDEGYMSAFDTVGNQTTSVVDLVTYNNRYFEASQGSWGTLRTVKPRGQTGSALSNAAILFNGDCVSPGKWNAAMSFFWLGSNMQPMRGGGTVLSQNISTTKCDFRVGYSNATVDGDAGLWIRTAATFNNGAKLTNLRPHPEINAFGVVVGADRIPWQFCNGAKSAFYGSVTGSSVNALPDGFTAPSGLCLFARSVSTPVYGVGGNVENRSFARSYSTFNDIALVMAWRRKLSDEEMMELNRDPWQVFLPGPNYRYLLAAALGGTVTINMSKKALQLATKPNVTNAKAQLTQTKKSVAVTGKTITPNLRTLLTQTKKALAYARTTVTSNAKSQLTQTKKAIAVSGKTITANAKSLLTQTKKALTVTGKTLATNAKTQLSQTKKAIAVTGKTFTPNAKQWLTQTKKAIAVSQKTFVVNAKTLLTQTKKVIAANGKVFVTNAKAKLIQTKKAIAVAGKSIGVSGAENIVMVKRAYQVTSKAFGMNAKVWLTQTKKAIAVTGNGLTTNAKQNLSQTAKAIAATGKALSLNAKQNLAQTKKAIAISGASVATLLNQRLVQTAKAIAVSAKAFTNEGGAIVIQNVKKAITVAGKKVHIAGVVEWTIDVGGMVKAGIANRRLVTSDTYKGWLAIGSHKGGARQVIDAVPPAPHFQNKNWSVVQAHLDTDNGDYTSI